MAGMKVFMEYERILSKYICNFASDLVTVVFSMQAVSHEGHVMKSAVTQIPTLPPKHLVNCKCSRFFERQGHSGLFTVTGTELNYTTVVTTLAHPCHMSVHI